LERGLEENINWKRGDTNIKIEIDTIDIVRGRNENWNRKREMKRERLKEWKRIIEVFITSPRDAPPRGWSPHNIHSYNTCVQLCN
jgi:hypothetical protein